MKQFLASRGIADHEIKYIPWIFSDYGSRGQYPYIESIRYALVGLKNDIIDLVGLLLSLLYSPQNDTRHRAVYITIRLIWYVPGFYSFSLMIFLCYAWADVRNDVSGSIRECEYQGRHVRHTSNENLSRTLTDSETEPCFFFEDYGQETKYADILKSSLRRNFRHTYAYKSASSLASSSATTPEL